MDSSTTSQNAITAATKSYNDFMFKVQANMRKNSEDLAQRIAKARRERKAKLKKRRTLREKMHKILRDLQSSEMDIAVADEHIKQHRARYAVHIVYLLFENSHTVGRWAISKGDTMTNCMCAL